MTSAKATVRSVKWFVRAAIRKYMSDGDRAFVANSEAAPFETLLDITDLCAGAKVQGEVFAIPTYGVPGSKAQRGERTRVGWVDEAGFFHGESRSADGAIAIAALIQVELPSVELRMRELHSEIVAIALWCHVENVGHHDAKGHLKRFGTIEVGW